MLGLLVIALIEGGISLWGRVPQHYNSDLLSLAPQQKERITSIFINEKINRLTGKPIDFIQVGDSSGFYGVKPDTLMQGLEDKRTWMNFGCCARAGFRGYRLIVDEVLRRQQAIGHKPSYMVLNMTPYYSPLQSYEDSELAENLDIAYAQRWRPHFHSAGWRLPLTNFLYRGEWTNRLIDDRVDQYWGINFSQLHKDLRGIDRSYGWMVRPGPNVDVPTDACDFHIEYEREGLFSRKDVLNRSLFRRELVETAGFAAARGLKLVVVFNPVPCTGEGSADAKRLQQDIDWFRAAYPDAVLPVPLIRVYPKQLFKDKWHLAPQGAERNSREIATALNRVL